MNPNVTPMTTMAREAAQTADVARDQIDRCGDAFAELGEHLRRRPPRLVVTCARGSSDHAATYGKYLIETTVGHVVASVGPSVVSIYDTRHLDLKDALFIAISQSGRSPDLLRLTEAARNAGAFVVGFVNEEASPLTALCHRSLPLCAGREQSIAATKSHVLAALAFLQLVAHWSAREPLREAVTRLPDALAQARSVDWWPALAPLTDATSMLVLGRGIGFGAALEMALKLKETCRLHAEGLSSAEAIHGPFALVRKGFPVLVLGQDDASAESTRHAVRLLIELGAAVRSVLPVAGAQTLPVVAGLPPAISPLCQMQSFYMAVPRLAAARGLDPDAPAHLSKVTETV
ncbi:MAG TPA: SIS domain-containing protein [Polyangiaceae bacterium]|nr:SIS domain-containing protein [Polyangiaceae bacterium]